MEVVTGATSSLLPKLGVLLQEEYKLQKKVKKDIESIQKELIFMNATLRMVEEMPPDQLDEQVRTWALFLRELSYDMEDAVDTFMMRVHRPGSANLDSFFSKAINMFSMGRTHHRIAGMIEDIKSLTKEVSELRDRYRLDTRPATTVVHPQPGKKNNNLCGATAYPHDGIDLFASNDKSNSSGVRSATHDIAEYQLASRQLVGMEEPVGMMTDMEKLEKWVTSTHEERAVLSIVGFGGVGKTTIAMALYQKHGNEFDYRASVTVSQNYDQDSVLRSILNQVNPQDNDHNQQGSSTGSLEKKNLAADIKSKLKLVVRLIRGHRQQDKDGSSDAKQTNIETMNHDQLVQELRRRLAGKKYLLLIDDIWSVKPWESIRNCLPDENENKKGSRIIVTSRFQAVGATCFQRDGIDLLHTVDFLKGDESKKLFVRSVSESKSGNGRERVWEEVHEEIWKICGGLPLAIVTMAGLVACNPNGDWRKVRESLFPEPVTTLTLNGVTRILDCCYNDLPADLKTCTLYLSIFPRGWKISRKRLTRLWIVEGFVSEKQGLTEEEVAETYFNQLIRRKIIRPVEHSSNGKVKTFQVHDMVLEYIVTKSSEENFITVVGGHWLMPAPSNKVRRLSMQCSGSKHGNSTKGMNLSQLRSLTLFGSLNQLPFHSFKDGIIQVLDLEGWNGLKEKHLKDICKMLVLKYLSIRRTGIAIIPRKIEKLKYLETLDIRETNVGELPKTVFELKRISSILGGSKKRRKGLRLPQEKSKEPTKSEEQMKVLRVLSGIEIVGESTTAVAGLHQLTGLKKLAIYKLNIEENGETFKELRSSIEYLSSCGLQTLAINDEGSDFINSLDKMSAPRYLIALELSGKLERVPKWIDKLSTLNKLTLSVTVLHTSTFEHLCNLSSLFSLTFSLSTTKSDLDIEDILEKNKSEFDGEIFVPGKGFQGLKLLRFFAPLVPKLSFSEGAMPALERIEMRFEAFEGLFGIDTLESLQEVHLRVSSAADEMTKYIVEDLKNIKQPKIIVDHVITD